MLNHAYKTVCLFAKSKKKKKKPKENNAKMFMAETDQLH